MVWQTTLLFPVPLPFALAGFVFSGTVCSYNFHWYLTPPHINSSSQKIIWNISNRHIHFTLFLIGLTASAVFAFLLIAHWLWLAITAFVTFLYSAPKIRHPRAFFLRKIAVGKTIFLAFAWTHVTAILPLVINNNQLTNTEIGFVVNRFFFIYAICILFDYRDRENDKKEGVKTLITYLTEPGIDVLFWGSILVFGITILFLSFYFSLFIILALLFPGVLLSFLYYPSKNNLSDYRYYFVLDGLMMLSALILAAKQFFERWSQV